MDGDQPAALYRSLRQLKKKSLFIYARYDTTFPLRFSEQVIAKARELGWTQGGGAALRPLHAG